MIALVALAATLAAQALPPNTDGYTDPWNCYLASGAYLQPTVALCIDVCDSACPQWLVKCASYCAGAVPPDEMIRDMTGASIRLATRTSTDIALDTKIIEVGRSYPDETVQVIASALAGETPLVTY